MFRMFHISANDETEEVLFNTQCVGCYHVRENFPPLHHLPICEAYDIEFLILDNLFFSEPQLGATLFIIILNIHTWPIL